MILVLQIDLVKDSVVRRGSRRVSFTLRKVIEILVLNLLIARCIDLHILAVINSIFEFISRCTV
jgi:hypothetical protein